MLDELRAEWSFGAKAGGSGRASDEDPRGLAASRFSYSRHAGCTVSRVSYSGSSIVAQPVCIAYPAVRAGVSLLERGWVREREKWTCPDHAPLDGER